MKAPITPLSLRDKVRCAWNGLRYGFQMEPNLRIMFPIASLVNFITAIIGYPDFKLIIVISFLTISLEYMNTSIEMLSDAVSPEMNRWIGVLKDIAGGSVLFMVVCDLMFALDIMVWWLIK